MVLRSLISKGKQRLLARSMVAWLSLVVAVAGHSVFADDTLVVSDIRIEGLQRVSADSVFAVLPIPVSYTHLTLPTSPKV